MQNDLPSSFHSQELFLLTNQATIRFRLLPERKTRARKWQKRRALSRRVAARRDGFSLDSASKKAPSLAVPSTRSKAWFQAGGTGRVGRGKTVFAVVENTDTMLAPPGVTSAGQNTPASSQLCTYALRRSRKQPQAAYLTRRSSGLHRNVYKSAKISENLQEEYVKFPLNEFRIFYSTRVLIWATLKQRFYSMRLKDSFQTFECY